MSQDDWTHLPLTDLSFQILLVLAREPMHGYGILQAIGDRTNGRLQPDTGTLYTAIRRLRRDRLVDPVGRGSGGRRGRQYRLTTLGKRVLALESRRLEALVTEARSLDLLGARRGAASRA